MFSHRAKSSLGPCGLRAGFLTTACYSQSTSVKLGMKIDDPGDSKPQNGLQRPARRGGPWEGSWALVKALSLPVQQPREGVRGTRVAELWADPSPWGGAGAGLGQEAPLTP